MARILIVDDEADMRMALSNVLSRMGHRLSEAQDGPSALDFLAREKVDLVLLDIRLPGMDGVQILRSIRETDKTTPVIMVTGYGSVESAVEVMQLGASHYLAKPFSNHELQDTVEKVLAGKDVPLPAGVLSNRLAEKVRNPIAAAPARSSAIVRREGSVVSSSVGHEEGAWIVPTVVMAGMVLIMAFWSMVGDKTGRTVSIPHENPTALVWKGNHLWTSDWLTQTIYEQELSGNQLKVVRTFPMPQTHITGLAVSDGFIYICDSGKKLIQIRKLDDRLTLVGTYDSPGPNPSGLFWDGRYLWSSDAARRRFYQHETEGKLSVLASYPAPGRSPAAIFKNDSYFWSADAQSRRLYQHRLDEKLGVLSSYSVELLDEGSDPLSSFTWKGDEIWLARDGSREVQVLPLDAFHKIDKSEVLK